MIKAAKSPKNKWHELVVKYGSSKIKGCVAPKWKLVTGYIYIYTYIYTDESTYYNVYI